MNEDTIIKVDTGEPKRLYAIQSLRYTGFELVFVVLGMIGAAGQGVLPILMFYIIGGAIDSVLSAQTDASSMRSTINDMALKMTYIAIGALVSAMIWFFFMPLAHGRIGTKLKKAYFDSLLDQEIGYFDMKRTGKLLNDMSEAMEIIQEAHTNKIAELTSCIAQILFAIIISLVTGWKMTLVMISPLPLFCVFLACTAVGVTFTQGRINHNNGEAASVSNEVVSSMRTIRSMDGEEREKKRFYQRLVRTHKVFLGKSLIMGGTLGAASFIDWAIVAFGFWYGGTLVDKGEMTFGELFMVFSFVTMAVMSIGNMSKVVPEFGKSAQSINDLLKVIKRVPKMRPSGGIQPESLIGKIEFRNVTFSYPTRPDVVVLKSFNLIIEPGQSIALVGSSGSGKSTIVGLIERFYDANSGEILLDGTNIADIDPRWLHRNIGIVTQEPTLFAATIKENILYAVKGSGRSVTDEDIVNAAKAANAHDFISSLPQGYNTFLGEKGVSLSGGQKQRIAIARAMIQDPKFLLLDEATSALDTQSEAIVQEALNKLMEGRTCIVIAHRLSTVVNSDVICVMSKGEIMEKGTHHDLMKITNGHYYNLASRQMLTPGNN